MPGKSRHPRARREARHAFHPHRRLAARHDPAFPRTCRGAAAVFGCPPGRGGGLGRLAAETGAEFVVVAGDVFEHNQLAPREVSQSLEAMRAIGVPVYLLPGNHDPLDARRCTPARCSSPSAPTTSRCSTAPACFEVRPGLEIVAAPWRSKAPTTDLAAAVLRRAARRRHHARPGRTRRSRRPRPGSGPSRR